MSGDIIDAESVLFTTANPALIGPLPDKIDVREGIFQILNVNGTFAASAINTVNIGATSITVTNANITNLTVAAMNVVTLGANSVTPTPPGSGVLVDGVLIRDRPHYQTANHSVACFETANPASTDGIDISLITYANGCIQAGFPDGTAVGGGTRGINAVDLQIVRAAADQVAGSTYSTIAGGASNSIRQSSLANNALAATISGGALNVVNANLLPSTYSVVGGGQSNVITDSSAAGIFSGQGGIITGNNASFIGGGASNTIDDTGSGCIIVGGISNRIGTTPTPLASNTSSIVGGTANQITGSLSSFISGGTGNVISGGSQNAIVGGQANSTTNSLYTVVGGYANAVGQVFSGTVFGQQNQIFGGSNYSTAIGFACQTYNEHCIAMGYNARSTVYMSQTFCATDNSGGANSNYRARSHHICADIFSTYVMNREVRNEVEYKYYGTVTIVGNTTGAGVGVVWIFPDWFENQFSYVQVCGAGGVDGRTAHGYGWVRSYKDNTGTMQGTGIFNGSAGEDSGYGGVGLNVGYIGGWMVFRIQCNPGSGVRTRWSMTVTMNFGSRIF